MMSHLFDLDCDMTSIFLSSESRLKCHKSPGCPRRCSLSQREQQENFLTVQNKLLGIFGSKVNNILTVQYPKKLTHVAQENFLTVRNELPGTLGSKVKTFLTMHCPKCPKSYLMLQRKIFQQNKMSS
jgi:hypothetical protein